METAMLTRRAFHQRLVALAFASALPRPVFAAAGAAVPMAEQVLNRLSFGANDASRAEFAALGAQGWLEAQLALPPSDADLDIRLAEAVLRIKYDAGDDGENRSWPAMDEMRPLSALGADPADHVRLLDFTNPMEYTERIRPSQEVISASLIRAVHAKAQLRELITQFWHDHFSVNALKFEGTAAFFPSYDMMLRTNAFGNFRVMLGEVARSPAMLYYLNNEESRASPANENFARELLELHTMGAQNYVNDTAPNWRDVPGAADGLALAYTDQDVYEVARAFTGWTVGDGRYVSEGIETPKTGRFHYVEAWHDPYQKRILGVEFEPNQAPMADGDRVMDILATHPGTAAFVCKKLIRRLLVDDPDPAMIDRIAGVFLAASDAPDQIAQVIRAIVADPLFAETPPSKLRRPFEFLAGLYRATGAQVKSPEMAFDWQLSRAGWHQHTYGPPTGHPDRASRWSSASNMNRYVDLAFFAHDDWFGCTDTSLGEATPVEAQSFAAFTGYWVQRLRGPDAPDVLAELSSAFEIGDVDAAMDLKPEDRNGAAAMAVAFAAMTPQFMRR
jgi:uncharacterized protein (DUF1800 family)